MKPNVLKYMWFLLSVLSFCTNSNSSLNSVYIDSSLVPIYQNSTCFCTIDVLGNVNASLLILETSNQLETSIDNKTFSNTFSNAASHAFGTGVVVIRYTTYDQIPTSLCLRLDGNNMQVSCKRLTYSLTLQSSTSSTDPYTDYVDNHNVASVTVLSSTVGRKTTAGTAKENKHVQNGTWLPESSIKHVSV